MNRHYRKDFKKTVYGFAVVEASTEKEARELFDEGDYDEFDTNSEHEWTSGVQKHD